MTDEKSGKTQAIQMAVDQIEKQFGKGAIMKLGDKGVQNIQVIPHRSFLQLKTVLDFGCGNGEESLFVARHGARRVVGIDLSEVSVLDFSCADEIVAKLVSRLISGEYGDRFIILTGLNENQKENRALALYVKCTNLSRTKYKRALTV